MIDRAVGLVVQRLNQHLRARFGVSDDLAVATCPTDPEGKPVADARNRLVVFVTNITHDQMARSVAPRPAVVAGRSPVNPAPIHLNIDLMLASSFDPENYLESLKILSNAIQFFQVNPVFDRLSAPEMDRSLQQLSLEIHNLDPETAAQLWGTLGGRYLPSVQYRMRTIAIDAGALTAEELVIRTPGVRTGAAEATA
jgi:Pvc16 N-terminal domain